MVMLSSGRSLRRGMVFDGPWIPRRRAAMRRCSPNLGPSSICGGWTLAQSELEVMGISFLCS